MQPRWLCSATEPWLYAAAQSCKQCNWSALQSSLEQYWKAHSAQSAALEQYWKAHSAQSAECGAAKDKGSEVRDAYRILCIVLDGEIRLLQPLSVYSMVDSTICCPAQQQDELQANGRYTTHQKQRLKLILTGKRTWNGVPESSPARCRRQKTCRSAASASQPAPSCGHADAFLEQRASSC